MKAPNSSSVQPALRITVEDLETGASSTRDIPAGDYILVTAAPCFLDGIQTYSNRTHVLTVKGRTAP